MVHTAGPALLDHGAAVAGGAPATGPVRAGYEKDCAGPDGDTILAIPGFEEPYMELIQCFGIPPVVALCVTVGKHGVSILKFPRWRKLVLGGMGNLANGPPARRAINRGARVTNRKVQTPICI